MTMAEMILEMATAKTKMTTMMAKMTPMMMMMMRRRRLNTMAKMTSMVEMGSGRVARGGRWGVGGYDPMKLG